MKFLRMEYGFMDNVKDDSYFANKVRKDLIFIVDHTKDIDKEELSKNEILLDSMMFRLIQISENAKRLSDEYKESHPSVPRTGLSQTGLGGKRKQHMLLSNRMVFNYPAYDITEYKN